MIWWTVVLIVGLAVAYKVPKSRAVPAGLIVWAVFALLAMVGQGGGFGG
jgi:hypothetical protein